MNDIHYVASKLKVREYNEQAHEFEAYASVFNEHIPAYNEVMLPGAFKRTLEIKHGKVWVFDEHDWKAKVGLGVSGREDNHGLFVRAKFIPEVQRSREAEAIVRAAFDNGMAMGVSIGFIPRKWRVEPWNDMPDVTLHEEVELWEYSLVAFPANQSAAVTNVHTCVPFQDLPLASKDHAWDASGAKQRMKDKAGDDMKMFAKGFCWYDDAAPESVGSYKLPIADIVSGTLTAIPRGIFAAAGRLDQAEIPSADKERVKAHLGRYYKKLDMTPPWDETKALLDVDVYSIDDDLALCAKELGIPRASPSAVEIRRTLAAIRTGADLSTLGAELRKLTKLYSQ